MGDRVQQRRRWLAWGSALAGLASLAVLPMAIVTHTLRRRRLPAADPAAIIILGTAQYDGVASRQFAARLDHGLFLHRIYPTAQVITVGGALPGDRFSEAEVGANYLHARAEMAVTQVPLGSDTDASIAAITQAFPQLVGQSCVIVSDRMHALRAEFVCRRYGIASFCHPTPHSPLQFPDPVWFRTLVHECGGMVVVAASRLVGRSRADKLEDSLRRFQAWLWPSRRQRHEVLRSQKDDNRHD